MPDATNRTADRAPYQYTPTTDQPPRRRALLAWGRRAGAIASIIAIIVVAAGVLGLRLSGPGDATGALSRRVDTVSLQQQATANRLQFESRRIDSLFFGQRMTNYMLCVQLRRTDPAAVPDGCLPIMQARQP